MGQGFSLAAPPPGGAGIDVPELASLTYEKSIGSARFMKAIRARSSDGVVLVKILIKPYPMSLEKYKKEIFRVRRALADVPNAISYQRAIETETNGYLIRQFLYNSLYDRISTRPFLEDIEKRWLAYQLLCALRDCHAKDIYHGDIKTENTLVTSWNWLYLSDFSPSFKPVMLPEDNPADFSYYFDTSGRRTCYLAPERFVPSGGQTDPNAKVTWAMDVFSVGCVIAELFLEGPIFSLSQLYKYRKGEYDPNISYLSRIADKDLREMVAHMIQLDPQKRYSAEQYLEFYKGKVFPTYFYNFLHQYMELITDLSSSHYASPGGGPDKNFGEADQRIERVWLDFDKISYFLGHEAFEAGVEEQREAPRLGLGHYPLRLNIPNNEHFVTGDQQPSSDDGTLIFLTLVVSSLRNTARASTRVKACDILLAFAERLTDEAKLDRVLPYLMTLLNDKYDIVVIAAIRAVTQILDMVKVLPPVNTPIFLEYIMPRMDAVLSEALRPASPLVRATYASSLGKLATIANRFLALASALRTDASAAKDPEVEPGTETDARFDSAYDKARNTLVRRVTEHTQKLITDPDPYVRRAFLTSVPDLCVFFGVGLTNEVIITHLNTYLNDRDWQLKCAYFDAIVGIAAFVGSNILQNFVLPLMVQAITDSEEYVVHGALHSLAELANLGLLAKPTYLEYVKAVGRFTVHPNIWIRESAAEFIAAGKTFLSPAYLRVGVLPQIKPYLKPKRVLDFSELNILESLQKPLSRSVYDQALQWASKTEKGDFWKSFKKLRDVVSGSTYALGRTARNEEDEQWLNKLRNLGLAKEDEPKLLALREFIWCLSQAKAKESGGQDSSQTPATTSSIIRLRDLNIVPQTILFDEEPVRRPTIALTHDSGNSRTIKDALLDASSSIDDPVNKRRRAAMNNHRSRLNGRDNMSPASADGRVPLEDDGTLSPTATSTGRGKSSSLLSMPDDRSMSDAPYATRRALRHQPSAISLMNRKDSAKSGPETGTTEANAFGEVETPFGHGSSRLASRPETESARAQAQLRLGGNHSYAGNDPNIMKMLDNMYIDNFPHDVTDCGPMVVPFSRRGSTRGSAAQESNDNWRPSGKLVATLAEHTGPINRIVLSPDQQFFITAGDDGCVKIWDTLRFEQHHTHKARQTHKHASGARVLAACFVENTHCFISCATDGSINVVKVDSEFTRNRNTSYYRYLKPRLIREHDLADGEYVVWCEHFKHDINSILILATNKSAIIGIDIRTMSELYRLENPVHHGIPTCFCIDRKRNWLCLGTSHGVLDLWDLRFKTRLKGWGVPGKGSIYRVAIHPGKGRGKWVCVTGGTGQGEVTIWDLERNACREVYRVGGNKDGPRGYEAWEVDEDKPESMLGRFATNIEPSATGSGDRGVRAMAVGMHGGSEELRDVRHAYMITAGSDKKMRYWDLSRVENSVVFGGLQPDEGKSTYQQSHPSSALVLNTERPPRQAAVNGGTGSKTSSRTNRPPRSTVISLQQQNLMKSHLDTVTDLVVLETPYPMVVSVDRSGVMLVLQ
ncbi:Serine/threonine-protein kinase ppk19 [Podospora australis]|uniref:non-specific serine/threonine protein kinase n=1 Tax=Podospora australis TaxID=1536484 RepID=A0AAN6WS68_9PEZI|nr:Serine/threonine-protein kinase ppk19 [Podospora australis]